MVCYLFRNFIRIHSWGLNNKCAKEVLSNTIFETMPCLFFLRATGPKSTTLITVMWSSTYITPSNPSCPFFSLRRNSNELLVPAVTWLIWVPGTIITSLWSGETLALCWVKHPSKSPPASCCSSWFSFRIPWYKLGLHANSYRNERWAFEWGVTYCDLVVGVNNSGDGWDAPASGVSES